MASVNGIDTYEIISSYVIYRLKTSERVHSKEVIAQIEASLTKGDSPLSRYKPIIKHVTAIDELRLTTLRSTHHQFLSNHLLRPSTILKAKWQCLSLCIFPKLFRDETISWETIVQFLEFLVQSVVVMVENDCMSMVPSMIDWAVRGIMSYSINYNDSTVYNWIFNHGGWEELDVKNKRRKNYRRRKGQSSSSKEITQGTRKTGNDELQATAKKNITKKTRGQIVAEKHVKRAKHHQSSRKDISYFNDKVHAPATNPSTTDVSTTVSSLNGALQANISVPSHLTGQNDLQMMQSEGKSSPTIAQSDKTSSDARKIDGSLCFCGEKKIFVTELLYGKCSNATCNWHWCFVGDCKFETESPVGIQLHLLKHKDMINIDICSECGVEKPRETYQYGRCGNCCIHWCLLRQCNKEFWSQNELVLHQKLAHYDDNLTLAASLLPKLPASHTQQDVIYPWKIVTNEIRFEQNQCLCGKDKIRTTFISACRGKCKNCGRFWCCFGNCYEEFTKESKLDEHLKKHRAFPDLGRCRWCGNGKKPRKTEMRNISCANCKMWWCLIDDCNEEFTSLRLAVNHQRRDH